MSCGNGKTIFKKMELTRDDVIEPSDKTIEEMIAESVNEPHILDSGNRRQFETGAVRDIQEGKGRCDLLPLDVVEEIAESSIFGYIAAFVKSGETRQLERILSDCVIRDDMFPDVPTMLLEVAKHFEEGCKKYGENNWQKGIPTHCYIDSAVRHYLKWLRGDKDEPHDRAFCWNILCCIWTCLHKPELNEYKKVETVAEDINEPAAGCDRCVVCGTLIPEGSHVCEFCREFA